MACVPATADASPNDAAVVSAVESSFSSYASQMPDVRKTSTGVMATAIAYRPILLDLQLLKTTNGYLIKELAFKTPLYWTIHDTNIPLLDCSLHYVCYRHDPANVPKQRTILVNGTLCDSYSGLAIECGDYYYSDAQVLHDLRHCDLIFLKGHNKKRALLELFARNAKYRTGHGRPRVVNVDATTMDDEDAAFCEQHLAGGPARFSFKFVYRRLLVYFTLMCRKNTPTPIDQAIYLTNAVVGDNRYNPFTLGRPIWICPHDHTCGGKWFESQRCAALNVGILETLWFQMRDNEYRELVKLDNRGKCKIRGRNTISVHNDDHVRIRRNQRPSKARR